MANDKKSEALGMNYSTASAQLKKALMFRFVQVLKLDTCFRCGNVINSVEELSVEHKRAWLQEPDPKEAFFDLNNIAFSHLNPCNSGAGVKKTCKHGIHGCTTCIQERRRRFRERKRYQDSREYRRNKGWE